MKSYRACACRFLCSMMMVGLLGACSMATESTAGWNQWGGPRQDFIVRDAKLAADWPKDGPAEIWSRDLGDGYSGILVEGDRIYTMHRHDDQEAVICMSAATGETIWEHAYESSPAEGHVHEFGDGPRGTPLISGNRIYTIGVSGAMRCLDKRTGALHWSQELWKDFGGSVIPHGYASSPIEYKGMVIALSGGDDQSIIAFDKKNGRVVWKNLTYKNSYSTPKIYNILGQDQLVTFMATAVIGVDPNSGELKWEYKHGNQWGQNICMPVWHDGILFISSPEAGARGLKLTRSGDDYEVEEVWSTRKIQFYHVSAVREGDFVYGSTGTRQPCFMAAINMKSGKIAWRKRGFAKANCMQADGRLVIFDENGTLAMADANPETLDVLGRTKVFEKVSWTAPTLVGSTMFLRDRERIVALDVG